MYCGTINGLNQLLTLPYRLAVDGQEIPIGLTPVPRNGFTKEITLFMLDPLDPSEWIRAEFLRAVSVVISFI